MFGYFGTYDTHSPRSGAVYNYSVGSLIFLSCLVIWMTPSLVLNKRIRLVHNDMIVGRRPIFHLHYSILLLTRILLIRIKVLIPNLLEMWHLLTCEDCASCCHCCPAGCCCCCCQLLCCCCCQFEDTSWVPPVGCTVDDAGARSGGCCCCCHVDCCCCCCCWFDDQELPSWNA